VEFRNELLKYSGFVHVHSKKSAHSKTGFGEAWAERSLALLLDPSNERKLRHLIQNQPEVGLVFAEARDLFRRINFYWGASAYPLLRSPKLKFLASRLDRRSELLFPIGGMFWARTEAVMELLQVNWEYNDFPTENGQLDGQLQHSLERAFGEVAINAGFRLAIFDQNRQRFEIY
jgi:lipopolysaccharide biosynthesis protein